MTGCQCPVSPSKREWEKKPKLFSAKGFATQKIAESYSGFAVSVTVDIGTVAMVAEAKLVENNGELRIFAINRRLREGLIIETVNGLIDVGWRKLA